MDDLIAADVLHAECARNFRAGKSHQDPVGKPLLLHQHQRAAILKGRQERESFVLTSGTGSGKSLTYIVPIVDHVLRRGSGKGKEAIVTYPMNGLANSQHQWVGAGEAERLLAARPDRNLLPTAVEQQLSLLLPALTHLQPALAAVAEQRAETQLADHEQVRSAARVRARPVVRPVLPVDILGAYVLLPRPVP